ncbi:hypothetical protein NDU88_006793 [Pleurodeles waltl]|uniref:Uncharacterized protein n=1 Tax=Pleurodeles waltl TaxID=8319 RepID=A0AAV7N221_PLEWA|nr:hypothetical protein NDU88_006793 [Pleurodeles waltl]
MDSEGRSQQNNMRFLGFPERVEGSMVETFVEQWIRDVLQPVGLSRVFVEEHVHRALVSPPRPGAPPRAIIACLLNYKDRDCILRTAHETDWAVFENEAVWRWLGMWDKFGLGPSGPYGAGSALTSGVNGMDWRRREDGPSRVPGQRCATSVSRIEVQQYGTMAVVDPEQAIEVAESSDGEAEMLSVDS